MIQSSHQAEPETANTLGPYPFTQLGPFPSQMAPGNDWLLHMRSEFQLWIQINHLLPLGEQEAHQPRLIQNSSGSRAACSAGFDLPGQLSTANFKGPLLLSGMLFDLAPESSPAKDRHANGRFFRLALSVEYKPLWETWPRLTEVLVEQSFHETLGRPHLSKLVQQPQVQAIRPFSHGLGRRPGEDGISLHFTTGQTTVLTKADTKDKPTVGSPGGRLYLPTNLCPRGLGTHLEGGAQHLSLVQGPLQGLHSGVALIQRVPQRVDDELAVSFFLLCSRGWGQRERKGLSTMHYENLGPWAPAPHPRAR